MRSKKKLFSLVLVVVMVLSSLTIQAQNNNNNGRFNDVNEDHWAYDYIELMSELGIINGYGDGDFYPNDVVSREQFSKMMVLTLQLELTKPNTPFFKDVSYSDWSYPYVETARPYLTGFSSAGGQYFRPKFDAVREDMAYAIVRGLGLSVEGVDLTVLDNFTDKGKISNALIPYVAKAVEEGIMIGSGDSFSPLGTLKRAEAATLLARLITDEKVIYDDTKVIYDKDVIDSNSKTPTLSATVNTEKIYLDWTEVASEGFKYYKVVASVDTANPIYPTNGYMQAISDINDTDTYIKPNDTINGGDTSSLKPGQTYHISITAVYENGKYASNVVDVIVPAAEPVSESGRTPILTYKYDDGGLKLDWSTTEKTSFTYYKIVFSKTDETPVYPGDGYLTYISDVNDSDYFAQAGQGYNGGDVGGKLQSKQKYYVSITAVYGNGDKYYASNTVTITLP